MENQSEDRYYLVMSGIAFTTKNVKLNFEVMFQDTKYPKTPGEYANLKRNIIHYLYDNAELQDLDIEIASEDKVMIYNLIELSN